MAKVTQVRYEIPQKKANAADFVNAIFGGINARQAEKAKAMQQLLPVFAQMRMLEPGGEPGDKNTITVAGKTFTVTKRGKDWSDEANRLLAKKRAGELGERNLSPAEIRQNAKNAANDDPRLKQIATALRTAYETGNQEMISRLETVYNTMQRQILGQYIDSESRGSGLVAKAIPAEEYDAQKHVLAGFNSATNEYKVYMSKDTAAQDKPKSRAQQMFGKPTPVPEAKQEAKKGVRPLDVAAVAGPALMSPAANQFIRGAMSGARPLANSAAQQALSRFGSQGLARTAAGRAGYALGQPLSTAATGAAGAAAYVPYVAGGYLAGKGLGNMAYDLMPASPAMQEAAWNNPFIRAAARPWAFAINPEYRRGEITPDLMRRLGVIK